MFFFPVSFISSTWIVFSRLTNKHSQCGTFSKPYFDRTFSNCRSQSSPVKGWPYRFRSRGTTGSSTLDHDIRCLSCATRQSGNDIHDFCCCHLWCRRTLFCNKKKKLHLSQCHLGAQLNLCTFVILVPTPHSWDDRWPSMKQSVPSSLLHFIDHHFLVSDFCELPGRIFCWVFPILYPLLFLPRVFFITLGIKINFCTSLSWFRQWIPFPAMWSSFSVEFLPNATL